MSLSLLSSSLMFLNLPNKTYHQSRINLTPASLGEPAVLDLLNIGAIWASLGYLTSGRAKESPSPSHAAKAPPHPCDSVNRCSPKLTRRLGTAGSSAWQQDARTSPPGLN
jgi:hypothetical protein